MSSKAFSSASVCVCVCVCRRKMNISSKVGLSFLVMHGFTIYSLWMTNRRYSTLHMVRLPAVWDRLAAYELMWAVRVACLLCCSTIRSTLTKPEV